MDHRDESSKIADQSRIAELERRIRELEAEIASRDEVEHELRQSEERYRVLTDNIPGLFSVINPDHTYRYVSLAYAKVFGRSRDQIIGRPMGEVVGPLYGLVASSIDRCLAGERQQLEVNAPGPTPRTLVGTLVPDRGPDGTVRAVLALITDITDLRRSERRLQALFNSTSDFLTLLDLEHRPELINRPPPGMNREEVLDAPFWALVAPDDRQRIHRLLDEIVGEARGHDFSLVYVSPETGAEAHFSCAGAPVIVSGRVVGSVVSCRDVSERVQLRREKSLLQAQFRHAQKMEAVGQLAGGVAHDFNNILCAITGNAGLLLDELDSAAPHAAMVGEILEAADRAARLTRQLLTFSRKQVFELKVVDLRDVVKQLETMLSRLIGEDVAVRVISPSRLGLVRADRGQIEQVVVNLAVNARDAMRDGGELVIELSEVHLDAEFCGVRDDMVPGPYVLLSLSDEGAGMSELVLEHVFEPFFTTKRAGKGTGLGLATAYGIIQQHGGAIEVDSVLGSGSTFRVYLPVTDQEIVRSPDRGLGDLAGGDATVLVVEDEDMVRRLTVRLLSRLGYDVLSAASGSDALKVAADHVGRIDLVLTDVVMPGMNGRQLATALLRARPSLRVLYTSGYARDVIVQRDIVDEGLHFLAKPFSLRDLGEGVRRVLTES